MAVEQFRTMAAVQVYPDSVSTGDTRRPAVEAAVAGDTGIAMARRPVAGPVTVVLPDSAIVVGTAGIAGTVVRS